MMMPKNRENSGIGLHSFSHITTKAQATGPTAGVGEGAERWDIANRQTVVIGPGRLEWLVSV